MERYVEGYLVSYPDLCTLYYTVSDNAYVRLGLDTRLRVTRFHEP